MPRPRRGTEEVWYDTFSSWSESDRAAAIKTLGIIDRQLRREKHEAPAKEVGGVLDLTNGKD